MSIIDRLFALLLYLLPHHLLSQLMYWLTRSEWAPFKDRMIKAAIRIYDIDMRIAEEPNPARYPSFNAFFTRALKTDARPLADGEKTILCPVDGAVSQAGEIEDGRIFQAKGRDYTLDELLGGDAQMTRQFEDGSFATIYLSPRDYHRIHMPLGGKLTTMSHVPGRLFSVSPSTTRTVPRLFSRNERVINLFETEAGPMAVIMVGAIFVASMDTVWAGTAAPSSRRISHWDYTGASPQPVELAKGDEMGRFNMGSTVILLFGKEAMRWSENLQAGSKVQMGEAIGSFGEVADEAPAEDSSEEA
ncbi:archaetidylserine decarboxylase [Solemya velesiana gill symbiont]|uniref:Phosphatidylserine decarboxylase proenzyme n=1 Tax=Solemya velesiana gill symbiont TaxID=1918948 RepID=A0A1T2KMQ6_9GAMM|nr:archaetidylserine decarboxylase [Solemya velesiana gill symbiont]OOZ34147.1 phosphatidylserine decarboxylase [Solemya velesiana gill symbiont]